MVLPYRATLTQWEGGDRRNGAETSFSFRPFGASCARSSPFAARSTLSHDQIALTLGINAAVTDSRGDRSERDESVDSGDVDRAAGQTDIERERSVRTGDAQAAKNRKEDPPA
jgi:hypothetical protein